VIAVRKPFLAALLALLAGACGWFDSSVKPPLSGERQTVLGVDRRLEADERIRELAVALPDAVDAPEWPQPQGTPGRVPGVVQVDGLRYAWRASIGSGNSRSGRVSGMPVVAGGRVYAVDAYSYLSVHDARSGARLWGFDPKPAEDRSGGGQGGGVAVDGDRVYFATGYGQIVALDAANGRVLWRYQMSAPARSGPAVALGRVFAIAIDNTTHAVDAVTGRRVWSHSGISESAGFAGAASPVVEGTTVVAGYSSGEVFALRAESGRVLWSDSLSGVIRTGEISGMADIRGRPAVDRGMVIAASHAGRTVAIDLRSGARVWEQEIGSMGQPWVAGDFLFVMGVNGELACLVRRDGRARWVTQLPRFTDEARRRGRIVWTSPVVAGGRVVVANSEGYALVLDPRDGSVVERISLPGGVSVPAVAALRSVFLVTDDGDLAVLR
jgi:outer membrane protein assembly factor BamB